MTNKELKDKIKDLKMCSSEPYQDYEEAHTIYDEIVIDIAKKYEPKLMKKLDEIIVLSYKE